MCICVCAFKNRKFIKADRHMGKHFAQQITWGMVPSPKILQRWNFLIGKHTHTHRVYRNI